LVYVSSRERDDREALADTPLRKVEAERDVLVACRAQLPEAFHLFVLLYQDRVFAFLERMLVRSSGIEDLAQETFLRAYRAFPRFDVDGVARPSTWLLTIAARLALNERRRERNAPKGAEPLSQPAAPTPETEMENRELACAIRDAAGALPEDQRAAFILAEFHDVSVAEMARILEVPENTVKTRLYRARVRMQALLAPWMERSGAPKERP
jgi:RNA polymerase sigma-70 factor (ECF subfamily)